MSGEIKTESGKVFIPSVLFSDFLSRSTADDDESRLVYEADLLNVLVTIDIEGVLARRGGVRREFIGESELKLLPELRVGVFMNPTKGVGSSGSCGWSRGLRKSGEGKEKREAHQKQGGPEHPGSGIALSQCIHAVRLAFDTVTAELANSAVRGRE